MSVGRIFKVFAFLFVALFIVALLYNNTPLRAFYSSQWALATYDNSAHQHSFRAAATLCFFWVNVSWVLWTTVFLFVSPWLKRKYVRNYLVGLTTERHSERRVGRMLTRLITWSHQHPRLGVFVTSAAYFFFGGIPHFGDIPAIGVACGFKHYLKGIACIVFAMNMEVLAAILYHERGTLIPILFKLLP